MSIFLIVIIVAVVLSVGLKLRRGTFFRLNSKKVAPEDSGRSTGWR